MSRTTPTPSPVAGDDRATARRTLRTVAVAACVPYLSLKAAWIAGSRVGIPEGSVLLAHETTMRVVNAATVLMDACVVVLALLLSRPWGRRVPSWLLALPMWAAAGLLTPIMAGFPAQVVLRVTGFASGERTPGERPFLDEWVYFVVYPGFIVQGLALGALFVLYARERWAHLWRGLAGEPAGRLPGRGQRIAVVAAALLAAMPITVHLMWATGHRSGLSGALGRQYDAEAAVQDAAWVLYAGATVVGVVLLLARPERLLPRFARAWVPARTPLWLPLLLAGAGSAAVGCWGGWLLLASAVGGQGGDQAATPLMLVTYAVQMIIGLLVLGAGARFFSGRAAARTP
ncbi:hypothetical protein [Streptomyces cinnamoneus]|uniref:hypothetical protein n=1 Tax=Streptomyces cinnamoneus TaxID=53446 RepID=UPI000C07AA9F|nr:hypothetical protein [Streptomyces cinnamoneus]PPT12656.1 hypothetical protein CYQ11_06915 [Streptomyces cinnamoneus]